MCTSCLKFNECDIDKGQLLGYIALDMDLRESVVRKQEASIGLLVADAFFDQTTAFCGTGEGQVPCPDIALMNAGGLRYETACETRDKIPAGPIYEADIQALMPFENELWVVSLRGEDILVECGGSPEVRDGSPKAVTRV